MEEQERPRYKYLQIVHMHDGKYLAEQVLVLQNNRKLQ